MTDLNEYQNRLSRREPLSQSGLLCSTKTVFEKDGETLVDESSSDET